MDVLERWMKEVECDDKRKEVHSIINEKPVTDIEALEDYQAMFKAQQKGKQELIREVFTMNNKT